MKHRTFWAIFILGVLLVSGFAGLITLAAGAPGSNPARAPASDTPVGDSGLQSFLAVPILEVHTAQGTGSSQHALTLTVTPHATGDLLVVVVYANDFHNVGTITSDQVADNGHGATPHGTWTELTHVVNVVPSTQDLWLSVWSNVASAATAENLYVNITDVNAGTELAFEYLDFNGATAIQSPLPTLTGTRAFRLAILASGFGGGVSDTGYGHALESWVADLLGFEHEPVHFIRPVRQPGWRLYHLRDGRWFGDRVRGREHSDRVHDLLERLESFCFCALLRRAAAYSPPTVPYTYAYNVSNVYARATGVYDQRIVIDPAVLGSTYLMINLTNTEWSYPNGTLIPSWIQENASTSATNTPVWLRMNSIPALSWQIVYLLAQGNTFLLNARGVSGEAPGLSPVYAEWDNGQTVFSGGFYTNFIGHALPAGVAYTPTCAGGCTVSNGLSITACTSSDCGVYASYNTTANSELLTNYTITTTQDVFWEWSQTKNPVSAGRPFAWGFYPDASSGPHV